MKRQRLSFVAMLVMGFGVPHAVQATTGVACDGTHACQTPGTAGLTGPTALNISATQIQTLTAKNSATATANDTNTQYWFYAYSHSLAAPSLTTGSPSFDLNDLSGVRVKAGFSDPALSNPTTSADPINNGKINNLKAGTVYDIYVQACKTGFYNDASAANCSNWVLLPYSPITTNSLPVNPFVNPVPADITINTLGARVNGTVNPVDPLSEQISITNLDTIIADQTVGPSSFASPFVAIFGTPPAGYSWIPNTHYQYTGTLFYPYSQQTGNTPASFFTTPADPGAAAAVPTHFTVTLNWTNTGGIVGNPKNTRYQIVLTGPGAPGPQNVLSTTGNLGVAGNPAEAMTIKITGLQAGTPYVATVQAMNQNGAWSNSGIVTVNFTTLVINPTFSVTGVATSQATFNVTLNPPTGITDFIVERCVGGVGGTCIQDVKTVWPIGATIADTMGSLTPNTAYQFYVQFFEGVDFSAFSPQPDKGQAVNQFTTTPVAPTGGTVTGSGPNSINANFADPSTNPNGSTYELQICTNAGFTTGCQSVTGTKAVGTNQSLLINTLNPSTLYFAQVRTRNVTRPTWPDSGWTSLGSATTQVLITQVASISPNPVNSVTGTLSIQVNSNGAAPGMTYNWVIVPPLSTVAPTMCANNNSSTGNSCVVTFHQIGAGYSATVTVTDSLSRTVTSNVPFNVVPVPQSVTITPPSSTVNQGAVAVGFAAHAIDQFNNAISPVTGLTWTTPGGNGGNGFTPSGATVSFNPNGGAGTFNIHASVAMNGVTQADTTDATITVLQAAGTVAITGPASGSLNQSDTFSYKAVVTDLSSTHITNPAVVWSFVGSSGLVAGDPNNTIVATGFDLNGDATALFTSNNPGSYTVQALATFNAVQATGISPIKVDVIAGSIAISPSPKTVVTGNNPPETFTATVKDPFGVLLSNAVVTWSGSITGGGTLSTTGPSVSTNFSATTPGVFSLIASITTANGNTVTANDTVTVQPAGPQFDSLTFSPTGNKGGTVSVTAHDNAIPPPTLTHSWIPSDPSVTFTQPSGATTGVVFTKAGQFTLTDTITDHPYNAVSSSSTLVTVDPVLSGIKVCAVGDAKCSATLTLKTLQDQQFTATGLDQFGNLKVLDTVAWTANGGNVNGSGASASFSSPAVGLTVRVTAASGGATGFVDVTLQSFDVSGAYAYPVPYKASFGTHVINFKNLGTQAKIRIFTASGRKVFEKEVDKCATGTVCLPWDVKNSSGENLASGVYFYVIESPEGKKDGKLIIIQ